MKPSLRVRLAVGYVVFSFLFAGFAWLIGSPVIEAMGLGFGVFAAVLLIGAVVFWVMDAV